jgi:uncharacterized protein YbjT (DUF2867 family)
MKSGRICIVGGTGFVGRQLVAELGRLRASSRVLTRSRERNRALYVVPYCELVEVNVHDPQALAGAMEGCEVAVNLAGILNERAGKGEDFAGVHEELPARVGEAALASGITRLLHMSALNASAAGPSRYLRSRHRGEEAAHALASRGLAVTSFRPSVIFGPEDSFFNRFHRLLRLSPFVFPLASPDSRFAPVYVRDVVAAMLAALERPAATVGQRYDLCGPRAYSLLELVEYTARTAGLRRRIIGLNERLSHLQARVLERFPGQPFTTDNLLSLQVDSVCQGANGIVSLGIHPTALEAVVPGYIGSRNRYRRYHDFRTTAGRG